MHSTRLSGFWFSVLSLFLAMAILSDRSPGEDLTARLRRPIALTLSDDEQTLYVANQRSGSLSVIDLAIGKATREVDLGKRLSYLVAAGRGRLLACDEGGHEVLVLHAQGEQLTVTQRLPVAPYPVSLAVSADGRRVVVASLWSRRLTFLDFTAEATPSLRIAATLDLPFAPRCQLFVRQDSRLIVADAFGGRLGVIDPEQQTLIGVRTFPSHNIRGLAVSPNEEMLLVAHQMLNELAHTVQTDVHWGLLMSNDLRWLKLDGVLREGQDLYKGAHMHPLGHAGSATGDPTGLAVSPDGTVLVTLGGVGEIAVGKEDDFSLHRIAAGRRPTAVIFRRDGQRAYIANTFEDSISVLDLPSRETTGTIELGPTTELSLVDRGELLFYDAKLSHDGWMSCHSCHTDGHTNGLANDNFSDKSFGAPKQVLSLLGRKDTAPFAWSGATLDLPTQVRNSIENTMQSGQPPAASQVDALVAFIESLPSPPSVDALRETQDPAAVTRGQALFIDRGCGQCHAPPAYTTPKTYDVGLEDKQGNRLFNPPSLRGVGQRGPYLHDNRAVSLEDVFQTYGHQLQDQPLSDSELADLLAFLRSL